MQHKLQRIFNSLQLAKEKGVKEVDLFDDLETSNNIRVVKHRLNKMLGPDAVYVKHGIWYLDRTFWKLASLGFRDIIIFYELKSLRKLVRFQVIINIFTALFIGLLILAIVS
ncbi:hypothetical protein LCGC14_0418140 [marine sediment metagenome]|uniref:Uncharacterized protein n=1 Tax=marine sediment metagenome TaxID=412755 RepID=A0A0F9W100_9ZZZZ